MEKEFKYSMFRMMILVPLVAFTTVVLLVSGAIAQQPTDNANDWQFGASIYGWFPDLNGQTSFSPPDSDNDFEVEIEDILENLQSLLLVSFDLRKGAWGVYADAVYMDVGDSATTSVDGVKGPSEVPVNATADVGIDVESWIWNLLAYYRALDKRGMALDVVAGTRYLDVDQTIEWDMVGSVDDVPVGERTGEVEVGVTNWDVIFGVRGRFAFGAKRALFMPYYLDVGVGDSDLTWQGVAGLGYAFGWGEIVAAWRHLYYDMPSGSAIDDISFSGPAAGVTFRW